MYAASVVLAVENQGHIRRTIDGLTLPQAYAMLKAGSFITRIWRTDEPYVTYRASNGKLVDYKYRPIQCMRRPLDFDTIINYRDHWNAWADENGGRGAERGAIRW
jgi:hypothetical protein